MDMVLAALTNRAFLYRYLWRWFAGAPDDALVAIAVDGKTVDECKLLAGENSVAVQSQIEVSSRLSSDAYPQAELNQLYTKHFEGPGHLPAPPWESVYLNGEDLLFQESTLDVRNDYRSASYEAAGYPKEADDHIAIELGFMAALSQDAVAAYESGDVERAKALLSRQLMFLGKHLNIWLPKYVERMEESEKPKADGLYLAISRLVADVCYHDGRAIEELVLAL